MMLYRLVHQQHRPQQTGGQRDRVAGHEQPHRIAALAPKLVQATQRQGQRRTDDHQVGGCGKKEHGWRAAAASGGWRAPQKLIDVQRPGGQVRQYEGHDLHGKVMDRHFAPHQCRCEWWLWIYIEELYSDVYVDCDQRFSSWKRESIHCYTVQINWY